MKILKCLGFLILAALVFMAFVYPFSAVPARFEKKARDMAMARVENGSLVIKDSYIDESVRSAVVDNLGTIYTTAFWVAAAAALIVFCISLRPPHDCGGANYFNPIGLVFTLLLSFLAAVTVGLLVNNSSSASFSQFGALVRSVTGDFSYAGNRLFFIVIVPAVLEAVFRGAVFSFLEKIHFSIAVLFSTLLYGAAAFLIVGSYAKWVDGMGSAAFGALFAALIIGFVLSVLTWQLRSGIPAILSHILIAYFAPNISGIVRNGSIPLVFAAVILAAVLVVFVWMFTFLCRKVKVFAYDFPLTKHHAKMRVWLDTSAVPLKKLRSAVKKGGGTADKSEKSEKTEKKKAGASDKKSKSSGKGKKSK